MVTRLGLVSCLVGLSDTAAGLSNRVNTGRVEPMMCSLASVKVSFMIVLRRLSCLASIRATPVRLRRTKR